MATLPAGVERDRRHADRRENHVVWYKSREARLNIILVTMWITVVLLLTVAATQVRLVHRQTVQQERACLLIHHFKVPDPKGLC